MVRIIYSPTNMHIRTRSQMMLGQAIGQLEHPIVSSYPIAYIYNPHVRPRFSEGTLGTLVYELTFRQAAGVIVGFNLLSALPPAYL